MCECEGGMVLVEKRVIDNVSGRKAPAGKKLVWRKYRMCRNPECDTLPTLANETFSLEDADAPAD